MNIPEAIEIKETAIKTGVVKDPLALLRADMLSIEALKRLQEARKKVYFTSRSLLPGETE